ncbi:histidinol-phosphatase [Lachancea thermotolerans CBS 6340]|uniref:Histidinol-phosphatase n=1 Tax=Lachancea thermotolerans (strain ATCC 56472 / CBS 6340 / NRRL Y-8284) TaxID=559295 RepID=C5E3F8_LACTC|nr:KLTH0H13068p [Lachancea thermotolerans CBS 6340]CAR30569.1 KLTH0H13068p [Lachancea thermotolerans CBS 6340]
MHSHHSHSIDYVAHGVDSLEDIVARAVKMQFKLYCLTEHMPRLDPKYLYPEEITGKSDADLKALQEKFRGFLEHASEIKGRGYATKFIIGTEVEGCDTRHIAYAKELMKQNSGVLQFCIGSMHHVNGVPIDFDQREWLRALEFAGNNLKRLVIDYFEQQFVMISELRPLVVGHFDLFRLYCSKEVFIDSTSGQKVEHTHPAAVCAAEVSFIDLWPEIKMLALRNIKLIASYGGLIEINTSGLRKKLRDPYPGREFAMLAKSVEGTRFVLSDDAHGVAHVGVCYNQALYYIDSVIQLDRLHFIEDAGGVLSVNSLSVEDLKRQPFWDSYNAVLQEDSR